MAKISFVKAQQDLEEACTFLRAFTLGRTGFTRKDGIVGIQRVKAQCDRLEKLFGSGPNARKSATMVASARPRVLAAEARLALLH
ncbi:MAG: hypothetical protein EXR98_09590 [Gemmataceae bacterium]|nr:hypothetical protein [Gemmataceae bacterium]